MRKLGTRDRGCDPRLKSSRFTSGRTSQGSSQRLVSEQGLDLPSPLRITYVRALPTSPGCHRAVLGWTLLGGRLQAATGRKPHPLFPFSVPCAPWKKISSLLKTNVPVYVAWLDHRPAPPRTNSRIHNSPTPPVDIRD